MPEVTVIIPTKNRAHSIAAAVNSVLSQSVGDIEVIVVDDGSTDNTPDVLSTIRDPRLRVLRPDSHLGAGGARNYGAQFASSPILAFQDSDDLWLVDKLKCQLPLMSDADVVMVCGAYLVGGRNGRMGYQSAEPWMCEGVWTPEFLYKFTFITPTWLVRHSVFRELGGFDESMPNLEDWEFALRMFSRGKIKIVDTPVVVKYGGSDSLNWNSGFRISSINRILDKHKDTLAACPEVLARLYSELGTLHLHRMNSRSAKDYFRQSLLKDAKNLKTWGKYLAAWAGPMASSNLRRCTRVRRVRSGLD